MNKRVLVVEDEAMLALDIANQLSDGGFEVVGPATSVAKALELVERTGCDLAT
jgi:AmiR/NasT family two-component response regulator